MHYSSVPICILTSLSLIQSTTAGQFIFGLQLFQGTPEARCKTSEAVQALDNSTRCYENVHDITCLIRDYQPGAASEYNLLPYHCTVEGYRDTGCAGKGKLADFNAGSLHPDDESPTEMMWTWDQLDDWWLVNSYKVLCWDGQKT